MTTPNSDDVPLVFRDRLKPSKPKTIRISDGIVTEKVYCKSSLPAYSNSAKPIVFEIDAIPQMNIDLSMLRMYMRLKITDSQLKNLAADAADCAIKMDNGHSIFSDLKVYMNNSQEIFSSGGLYPYYCDFLSLFKLETSAYDQTNMIYDDRWDLEPVDFKVPGEDGKTVPVLGGYTGNDTKIPDWHNRVKIWKNSASREILVPVLFDLGIMQQKLLRDDVSLRLVFQLANSQFSLFSTDKDSLGDGLRLVIEDAYLSVSRFKLNKHYSIPKTDPLNYRYFSHHLSYFVIPRHTPEVNKQWSVRGSSQRLTFYFVKEDRIFGGSMNTTPFRYEPHGIQSFSLTVNGIKIPQEGPLQYSWPDDDEGDTNAKTRENNLVQAYSYFITNFRGSRNVFRGKIDFDAFKSHLHFISFDLSPTRQTGVKKDYVEKIPGATGSGSGESPLGITMSFAKPLDYNLVTILCLEEPTVLSLDPHGRVTVDADD